MQKWKRFSPPGKEENRSGTIRRRGKENTVGAAIWTYFLF